MRCRVAANGGLNATHRPRTLLSGLLFRGCSGGSYARRDQDRYARTNHVLSNGCDNVRSIDGKARHQGVAQAREHAPLQRG